MSLIAKSLEQSLPFAIQRLAGARLRQTLDSIAGCRTGAAPSPTAFDELLVQPFDRIDPRTVRDGYLLLRDGRRPPRPIRLLLLRRAAKSRVWLDRHDMHQLQLAKMCLISAGVFIPLLIAERLYRRAINLATAAKRAVLRGPYAVNDERPIYLLTPILWSLAAELPTDEPNAD